MAVIGQLRNRGVISPSMAVVLTELKQARNLAAHSGPNPPEGDEVVEYVKLAGRIRDALRVAQERLRAEPGHPGDDGVG